MRELFLLVTHLLATVARLMRPGGVRAVAAESLLLKHQLLILNRSRKRAPRLTPWDRLLLGFGSLFVHPKRQTPTGWYLQIRFYGRTDAETGLITPLGREPDRLLNYARTGRMRAVPIHLETGGREADRHARGRLSEWWKDVTF